MRFQTRVLVTYSLLILFLVVVLGIVFSHYSAGLFERNAASNYGLVASKISRQLDDVIRPMDFVSTNLLSDERFKSALTSLASIDRSDPRNTAFITEASRTIRSQLWTYSIIKNFHGVVVFNRKGDFFSSAFVEHAQATSSVELLATIPWLDVASAAEGRAVVVSPYADPWSPEPRPLVFSFARAIPGSDDDLGFLEVQKTYAELEAVFDVSAEDDARVLAFQSDGELFYGGQDLSSSLVSYYRGSAASGSSARFKKNPISLERELIIADTSKYSALTVVIVLNRRFLLRPLFFTRWVTVVVGLFIILFSVAFNWVSSRQLTKPLRLIKTRMEGTELANLPSRGNALQPGREPIDHPNDEIVALDRAFRGLTERLDEAIRNELHSRTSWMQARLDSLQAQINPHFLYNILTVIAGKGLEKGDEEIGDICDGIASMLRYSTSTAERSATLAEELEHVRTYLFLMKKRLEQRLEFSFDVDSRLHGAAIPKIVLQQIAENSINHGYRDTRSRLSIHIRGYTDGGRWVLEVTDDGAGFQAERLAELRSRFSALDDELRGGSPASAGSGMEIGGLGLINTYTRLHLFYRGDFLWELDNPATGGARVVLGAALEAETETRADAV
jgi:two-component system sensor histidine kinase YesM